MAVGYFPGSRQIVVSIDYGKSWNFKSATPKLNFFSLTFGNGFYLASIYNWD